jgi:hypothetical protein
MFSRSLQSLTALLLLALVAACADKPIEAATDFDVKYDFTKVRKIAIQPVERTNAGAIMVSDMQIARVNDSLTDELIGRGFEVVQDNKQADMFLVWHLVTQEKTDVRSYNNSSAYNCWRCGPATSSNISVRQYTEGTFIVDMIDPLRNRSVWRSTIQSRLKSKPDPQESELRRREAVRAVFARFPP